jgi:hypothetical protein
MKKNILLVAFITILFTLLFYRQYIGLNLFIFEIVLVTIALTGRQLLPKTGASLVVVTALALTSVFVVLHASAFVITMNLITLFIFCGMLLLPGGRSMVSWIGLSFENIIGAPGNVITTTSANLSKRGNTMKYIRGAAYFIIPLFLIFFFLLIYGQSNPTFFNWMRDLSEILDKWITAILAHINFPFFFVSLLGLAVAVFFIFRHSSAFIGNWDKSARDVLVRPEQQAEDISSRSHHLKSQYMAAVFLLISLNLLIALQNVLDIRWIWFGFEWNGQYLQQFVHAGTFLLIISIVVSALIILWFFRGTLNFYPGNGLLKKLSYAWILQNMILSVSVGFRVYWYVYYFALAYLRIGVIIFLVITVIGLITVLIKVRSGKSFFYLFRVNTLSVFIVLTLSSLVNWDNVIAKYNFSHFDRSFVHLDWLCTLSDKALPVLDKSPEFLSKVKQVQDSRFSFEMQYMDPKMYHNIIGLRKKMFLEDMDNRSFLSWNLADAMAAKKLRATELPH